MSDPRYKDGDVVWCKCGGLFWPGEVKGLASLPEEIRDGFLRMPLVVVKFFDEDGYEFVLNDKDIYPYNCEKKIQFIQKGVARYRTKAKEGATAGWFAKFPKDVIHCESLTGGNVNILDEEPFAEKKEAKVDYSKIFGEEKEKGEATPKSKKKSPSETPAKSVNSKTAKTPGSISKTKSKGGGAPEQSTPKPITHPRFTHGSDHEVRILTQPSTPYHIDTQGSTEPKVVTPNYRCPMCDFAASRLNVIVLHSKTHSASKVSYAPKAEDRPQRAERPKPESSGSNPAKKRERPVTKQDKKSSPPNKKPRLTKKQREERKEKEKKKEEEKNKLLIDWSEDENEEAEEFKKIQESINQSLRTESSDDDDDDLLKSSDHHYSMDSDDEAPLLDNSSLTSGGGTPVPETNGDEINGQTNNIALESESASEPVEQDQVPTREQDSFPKKDRVPSPQKERLTPSPAKFSPSPAKPSPSLAKFSSSPAKPSPSPAKSSPAKECIQTVIKSRLQEHQETEELESKLDEVPDEKRRAACKPEPSPPKQKPVTDMFDINQALEETSVPELPSFASTKFKDQSPARSWRKDRSPTKLSPSKGMESRVSASLSSADEFSFSGEETGSPPSSPPPKRPGILKKSDHGSIQLPTRPDGNAQLIRHTGHGSKFASISAKIKAKQLARAQRTAENGAPGRSSPSPQPAAGDRSVTAEAETVPAEGVVAGAEQDPGDEQIYYMLVDDGSQLENQTILIDESQLSAATGAHHGNLLIQSGPGGEILVQSGAGGELLLQSGLQGLQGARTVLLRDANGELVNVVVADDKDLRHVVTSADTTGGVATLPSHPSSSLLSQVPLITTPSGLQPIMVSTTLTGSK